MAARVRGASYAGLLNRERWKLGRVVDGLLNDAGDVTDLEGKLGQTERRKRKLKRSSTLRHSSFYLRFRFFPQCFPFSPGRRSSLLICWRRKREEEGKKKEKGEKGNARNCKFIGYRMRGKISLNELWYFVGTTLELIWVKEGSWMALLARWRHGVQTPATGSTLVDSVMAVAINGPGSSFHVFHVFSRENVFRQRAHCTHRDSRLHSPLNRCERKSSRRARFESLSYFWRRTNWSLFVFGINENREINKS